MRTVVRTAALGLAALTAAVLCAPAAAAAPATGGVGAPARAGEVNQGYSIPVGAITDLGALPVVAALGNDFARLLGY